MKLLARLRPGEELRLSDHPDQGRYDMTLVVKDTGKTYSRLIFYQDLAKADDPDKIFNEVLTGLLVSARKTE